MQRKITKIEHVATTVPKKKKVAAYARVSSGKAAMLHSLSAQISYYSEWIQRQPGWDYVGVYADKAMTGTKDSRAEFQKLLNDCRVGKIDLVLTKSISRFARNTLTMLEVVRELKTLNVDVYFEKENIHSISGDGELMLTILASFAQEESRSVSENCKWRIRKRFADGEIVNLRFLFGYRIRRDVIEIDLEQAEIVRMIFCDYISGMGCTKIARKLRDMGVPTMRGGVWNSGAVSSIIKNEKYLGNALLQKKYVEDHLKKTVKHNHGVLPQYYATDTHSSIIDEATFQKAQKMIAKNKQTTAGNKIAKDYPLSGKIVCGECGNKYKHKNNHGKVAWICMRYAKYGKTYCQSKQISDNILLPMVTQVLGLAEFDKRIFAKQIKEIQVCGSNHVQFIFLDGQSVRKEWENASRKESWDEKARQQAREHQQKQLERRSTL